MGPIKLGRVLSFAVRLILFIAVAQAISAGLAVAQTIEPTPEQLRMINQLPPEQRRQALDALHEFQAQQRASSRPSTSSRGESISPRQARDLPDESEYTNDIENTSAQAGTSLVISLTPKSELNPEKREAINNDPALARVQGSHFYELDKNGELIIPGLRNIPLLGLSVESIEKRLGAEPALSAFDVQVSILSSEKIGTTALKPFGYDLFESNEAESESVSNNPPLSGPVPADYILGPGDVVRVQLFGNVNNSYDLEISRDGTLNIPELGPMDVAGVRFSEFRDELDRRVQRMLIGTQASISMGALRSIMVFVVGDVNKPGSYVVSSLATVSSALYESGGISKVGTLRDIQLKRQGRVISHLDLYDLLLHGDSTNDEQLRQGDVVFVPPIGATVSLGGAVKRPAIYEARVPLSLADAISLAGGLTADAYPDASTLQRIDENRERSTLSVNLTRSDDLLLAVHDGDLLSVPQVLPELTQTVILEGHVKRAGPREWHKGMRLVDLIPSPESLRSGADADYVLIRREKMPGRRIQIVSADLAAAMANPQGDDNVLLQSRDSVHVFDLAFGRQRVIAPILDELRLHADFDSPYREVRVAGMVRAPGDYPLEDGMRVSDLVRAGGNLSEGAYTEEAELTRFSVSEGEVRKKEVIVIDLAAALRGNENENLLLSPYDHLKVSQVPNWMSDWSVSMEGEVKFPGRYQISRGDSLRSVLHRAGGLTAHAFPEGAIFLRESLKEREREQIEKLTRRVESDLAATSLESLEGSGADALNVGKALVQQLRDTEPVGRLVIDLERILRARADGPPEIELKDGDRLLIPGRSQEVTVLGEAQYPTSHLYKDGLTRDDYIALSGGTTRKADKSLIYVVRANGAVLSSNRSNWFSRSGDTKIRPGDTIVIPVETDRIRPLTFWTNVSQIFYQSAIAVAAIRTFNN